MKIEKAMEFFHGIEGYNCIQSVLKVFQEEYKITEEYIRDAQIHGGGRAEGGVCGALYAIKMLVGQSQEELYNKTKKLFEEEVGSQNCLPIKANSIKSCRECVGIAVKFLEENK